MTYAGTEAASFKLCCFAKVRIKIPINKKADKMFD
jgi:hypothetical protein